MGVSPVVDGTELRHLLAGEALLGDQLSGERVESLLVDRQQPRHLFRDLGDEAELLYPGEVVRDLVADSFNVGLATPGDTESSVLGDRPAESGLDPPLDRRAIRAHQ